MRSSRRRVVSWSIALTLIITWPVCAQPRGEHLALVTEMKGKVVVQRASDGALIDAEWGTQLYKGDQVRTTSGAQVSLFFSNNNLITIGPNSSMMISAGPTSAENSPGMKAVSSDLIADASSLTLHRSGSGEISALGGLRASLDGGSRLELLGPRNTKVATTRPDFSWTGASGDEPFLVTVFDENGVIWSGESTAQTLSLPVDGPELERGRQYFWQVEVDDLLDPLKSDVMPFYVLSAQELEHVRAGESEIGAMFADDPEAASRQFVLGLFYAKEGLLSQAITAFSEIARRHETAAMPHEILGRIYYDIGLKDHAVESLHRALSLNASE